MAVHIGTNLTGDDGIPCLEFGALDAEELSVFAMLIDQRRPLPIYLGDTWRCDVCLHECADIAQMGHHILTTHPPEPGHEDDWEEWLDDDLDADDDF